MLIFRLNERRVVGGVLLTLFLSVMAVFSAGWRNERWKTLTFDRPLMWETVTEGDDGILNIRPAWNFRSGLWLKITQGGGGEFIPCSPCTVREVSSGTVRIAGLEAQQTLYEQKLDPPLERRRPVDGERIAEIYLPPDAQHPETSEYRITYSLEGNRGRRAIIERILQSIRFDGR